MNPLRNMTAQSRWWVQLVAMVVIGALAIIDLVDGSSSNTITIIVLVLVAIALVDLALRLPKSP